METILILHGWGIGSKTWVQVKRKLEEGGHKVFVPDLPGFGKCPAPEKPWSIDDYVSWVRNYCEKNNLLQFFLVGHSFGGGLAVKFSSAFPEKVKKLVLVAPKIRRQRNYRYYLGMVLAKLGAVIFFIPPFCLLKPLARKVLYKGIGTQDYYRLETQKAVTMKETFKKVVSEELVSYLPKIKVPTLIIWGTSDDLTPLEDAYLIHEAIKGSRLEVIKNGEHALNLQKPGTLVEKIVDFIKL